MQKSKIATEQEYLDLIEEIKEHDRLYYQEARPVISDYEYDLLVKRLQAFEKENPGLISPDSPSYKVRDAVYKGFVQKEHVAPMLSLANTYSQEEVKSFLDRVKKLLKKPKVAISCELKLDGTAISLRYEKGVLVRALTRGNGKKGDDITQNIYQIRSLPRKLKTPETIEVRGEVYMSILGLQKLNQQRMEQGLAVWANPRNAAAGSLKLLDPQEVAKRNLQIACYGLVEGPKKVSSQFEIHLYLKKLGLPVVEERYFTRAHGLEEIFKFATEVEKARKTLSFEIDGIVLKVDDLQVHDSLGVAGKFPRYAVAYKFSPEQAETLIEDITVQVGRTGVLTPVAELKPVFLAGSTIRRATLHNVEEVERKDIRIEDTVIIEKGGDVIPKVVRVVIEKRPRSSKKWTFPRKCPICHAQVERRVGEVAIRCTNPKCGGQKLRKIIFFASKNAMDIEHMGEKVVELLFNLGLVQRISDIYLLEKKDFENLEGFKEKSIQNLLQSIEKSKECTLAKFIFSLGIPYVGTETADLLANAFGSIQAVQKASLEELIDLEGIGEKTASAIVTFFSEEDHLKEIELLIKYGIKLKAPKKAERDPFFFGKTFVLTGTLELFSRTEATELIKQKGGKVSSSVSSKTDFVLAGENPGSKYDKAKKLGVKILTEKTFSSHL